MPRINIPFIVDGQSIIQWPKVKVAAGGKNYFYAVFETHDDAWGKINSIRATFECDNVKPIVMDVIQNADGNLECKIPWEVMTKIGYFDTGMFGGDRLPTTTARTFVIQGCMCDGDEPRMPTPDWFDKIEDRLEENVDKAVNDKLDTSVAQAVNEYMKSNPVDGPVVVRPVNENDGTLKTNTFKVNYTSEEILEFLDQGRTVVYREIIRDTAVLTWIDFELKYVSTDFLKNSVVFSGVRKYPYMYDYLYSGDVKIDLVIDKEGTARAMQGGEVLVVKNRRDNYGVGLDEATHNATEIYDSVLKGKSVVFHMSTLDTPGTWQIPLVTSNNTNAVFSGEIAWKTSKYRLMITIDADGHIIEEGSPSHNIVVVSATADSDKCSLNALEIYNLVQDGCTIVLNIIRDDDVVLQFTLNRCTKYYECFVGEGPTEEGGIGLAIATIDEDGNLETQTVPYDMFASGPMIVTYENDDYATYTGSEIYEAFQAGKDIVFRVGYPDDSSMMLDLELSIAYNSTAIFIGDIPDEQSNGLTRVMLAIDESGKITTKEIMHYDEVGGLSITNTATVGQTIVVSEIDADGKPTKWEAVDISSGGPVEPAASVEPAEDDIPKVFFGGPLQQTKDEAVVPFRYISKTEDLSGYAEIKAQGNSSMGYPKKNQTVKLFKDADCTEKLKMDFNGWGKQNKHVYKANWIDLTHARNVISARLWADIVKSRANYAELPELLRTSPNQGAIDGFPIKVYADGVYQGRYTLNIPKDKWAFNMDDDLDVHCVLCGENYASGCFRASANINGSDWSDEIHDTVPSSIKTRWNEVISFVMNSTDEEFKTNLNNYFYVDSLIDYHLFGLASCGLDAYGKNQLYATYDGQKWIASMYDMDSTWGLYWNGSKFVSTDYARTSYEDMVSGRQGNLLYIRLEKLFWPELQARWVELKNGALSIENIINRFERFTDIAPIELVKEDYASTTGGGKFTGIPSKDTNNIQQIRSYALARLAWTDSYMSTQGDNGEVPEPEEPDIPVEPDETSIVWTDTPTYGIGNSNGLDQATGANYVTNYFKIPDSTESITMSNASGFNYTWLTVYVYDENKNYICTFGAKAGTAEVVVTVESTYKYLRLSAYPNNVSTNNDPANQITLNYVTVPDEPDTPDVPEEGLLYSLPEATTFNGTSDYIDTGVKLMSEPRDMTICIDCDFTEGLLNESSVFHCMNEISPYPGIGLCMTSDGAYAAVQQGYRVNGIPVGRRNVALVFVDGALREVKYFDGEIKSLSANGVYAQTDKNLLVGCYQKATGEKGRYWRGTIYDFKVYDHVMSESEINTFLSGGTEEPDVPDNPDLPEESALLYSLPGKTTFDGTNHIDTGVKLFAEDKPFTVVLDWEHTGASQWVIQHTIAHCARESSPWPGLIAHYTGGGIELTLNQGQRVDANATIDGYNKDTLNRVQAVFTKDANGNIVISRRYNCVGEVYTSTAAGTFVALEQTLLLGCYQTTSGTLGRFAKGILHDCKVYNYAMSDEEISDWFNSKLVYSLSKTSFDATSGIDTGIKLQDEIKDYTVFVDFTPTADANRSGSYMVIEQSNPNYPWPGWGVSGGSYQEGTNAAITGLNKEILFQWGEAFSRHKFVIRHSEGKFYVAQDGNTAMKEVADGTVNATAHDYTVKIGSANTLTQKCFLGIIHSAKIWLEAKTDEECLAMINT